MVLLRANQEMLFIQMSKSLWGFLLVYQEQSLVFKRNKKLYMVFNYQSSYIISTCKSHLFVEVYKAITSDAKYRHKKAQIWGFTSLVFGSIFDWVHLLKVSINCYEMLIPVCGFLEKLRHNTRRFIVNKKAREFIQRIPKQKPPFYIHRTYLHRIKYLGVSAVLSPYYVHSTSTWLIA